MHLHTDRCTSSGWSYPYRPACEVEVDRAASKLLLATCANGWKQAAALFGGLRFIFLAIIFFFSSFAAAVSFSCRYQIATGCAPWRSFRQLLIWGLTFGLEPAATSICLCPGIFPFFTTFSFTCFTTETLSNCRAVIWNSILSDTCIKVSSTPGIADSFRVAHIVSIRCVYYCLALECMVCRYVSFLPSFPLMIDEMLYTMFPCATKFPCGGLRTSDWSL